MKSFITACLSVAIAVGSLGIRMFNEEAREEAYEIEGMEEDLRERTEWMNQTLANPYTHEIPEGIRQAELTFSATIPFENFTGKHAQFTQIGPYNVGGRTRSIAQDIDHTEVLLAGSTMGGIWRSGNNGQTWNKCNTSPEVNNISCFVQDLRNGKHNNWYAGTGELYGASLPGAFYAGNGIYKSTNGGISWNRIGNLITPPGSLANNWSAVHRIVINTAIDSIDVLFAANFDGVFRSLDGGITWSKKRGSGISSGKSYFTDVLVTPKGIVYAALSGGGSNPGIWRSKDNGNTWTNISPSYFPASTERVVMCVSPKDENQLFFVANTPGAGKASKNFEGNVEWNSLWKYTYLNGDGAGNGGLWSDRSENLPAIGGAFGDFIAQGGYCIDIKFHPTDTNIVLLGGTNLYRSTDAFRSTQNITWIGGYKPGTFLPDFKVYENHHPDNHLVLFDRTNSNKMYSVHDGGISVTENILAKELSWNSLNNGYTNTQFYSVAISQNAGDNRVIGGLQDNGTLFCINPKISTNWIQPLSYDGSFCFVSPKANEYYMSIQQGRVMRLVLNADGSLKQYARIDPRGVDKSKYQFINPFTPDASNFDKIYIPAGNVIWRNDDVSQIPLNTIPDSTSYTTNWHELTKTLLPTAGDEITAIISSKLENDVIYYGTSNGKFYKLNNASADTATPVLLSNKTFPSGYINCITQDPNNAQKLYVVFTNYGILSVFESIDGGKNWQAISGNLEESSTGAGNGPSCRWLTIAQVGDSNIYYLGTSTGLYACKQLNGMSTTWYKQKGSIIGNQVVMMMDYRKSDGLLAVATYGAGVFTGYVNSLDPSNAVIEKQEEIKVQYFPNPVQEVLHIKFENAANRNIYLYNIAGKLLQTQSQSTQFNELEMGHLAAGNYLLVVTEGTKKWSRKIVKD